MSSGIPCPECGSLESRVYNSRPRDGTMWRRRECANGHRFTTTEAVTFVRGPAIDIVVNEAHGNNVYDPARPAVHVESDDDKGSCWDEVTP